MITFLFTVLIIILSFILLAIGVIISKKALKGSCGGLGTIMGNKCLFCNNSDECKGNND